MSTFYVSITKHRCTNLPALHVLGMEWTLWEDTDDPKSEDVVPPSTPVRIALLIEATVVPIIARPWSNFSANSLGVWNTN